MTLKEFIENYIQPNSMVRLLYKDKDGNYRTILNDWDKVAMDWEIVKGTGILGAQKCKYAPYINHEVIGIACISVTGHYSSAINIVIEEIPLDELRENKLETLFQ
jgi:hypothetical protein